MADAKKPRSSVASPRLACVSAPDSYQLWTRVWDSQTRILRARVVVLHGVISHGGWYLRMGSHLAEAGVEVHLLERRGSGLNRDRQGDVDTCQQWLDDVQQYLDRLDRRLPVLLLGISWGGKLAVAVARERQEQLAGIGLISPGLFAHQAAGRLKRMLLHFGAHGRFQQLRVKVPLEDPALFTDDADWQEYVRTDPLALRRITLRFAREDLRLTKIATDPDPTLRIPTLLMLAGRDRIVDQQRTREFVASVTERRGEIIDYPDAAHTLDFGSSADTYLKDLRDWVIRVADR